MQARFEVCLWILDPNFELAPDDKKDPVRLEMSAIERARVLHRFVEAPTGEAAIEAAKDSVISPSREQLAARDVKFLGFLSEGA